MQLIKKKKKNVKFVIMVYLIYNYINVVSKCHERSDPLVVCIRNKLLIYAKLKIRLNLIFFFFLKSKGWNREVVEPRRWPGVACLRGGLPSTTCLFQPLIIIIIIIIFIFSF
jgi:hypothetical protein